MFGVETKNPKNRGIIDGTKLPHSQPDLVGLAEWNWGYKRVVCKLKQHFGRKKIN